MSTGGFKIKKGVFLQYDGPEVEVLEIPEGVVALGEESLYESEKKLGKCKKIIIPSTVKRIESRLINYNFNRFFDALEEIVIKGDVELIGEKAFCFDCYSEDGNTILRNYINKVVFEGHVGRIGRGAFQNTRIKQIIAPMGIDQLDDRVFWRCKSLEEVVISGLKSVGEDCFKECKKLKRLEIPDTCKTSTGSFAGCVGLANKDGQFAFGGTLYNARNPSMDTTFHCKWTSIPEGVTTIDDYALEYIDELLIPYNVTTIKRQRIYTTKKIGYEASFFKKNKKLSGEGFYELLRQQWAKSMSAEDWAYLYLYQSGKTIEKILEENRKDSNDVVTGMLNALEAFGKEKQYLRAAEYILTNREGVSNENVRKMYNMCVDHKSKKAADLLMPFVDKRTSLETSDPYFEWKNVYTEHILDKCIKANKGDEKLFSKVRLNNSEEFAPSFLVKCAVVPYLDLYSGRPKHIGGYKTDYVRVEIIELADKAAAKLNINDVQELIEKEYKKGGSAWLIPYGRYASGKQITSLIADMRKWADWYSFGTTGRSDIIIARGALMLSDTREAMMNIDKSGLLYDYATRLRGKDVDTIRDTVLAEFGLDASGKKVYDLGSKKVEVSLSQDLTLVICDLAENKVIKSIPKKGTDPKIAEEASADYAEIKKNVKKVVKGRNDLLFNDFLLGTTKSANSWITSYTKNPLLRRVAELIVWKQGNSTFILTENGAIDCNGKSYEIDKTTGIGVAHPMEMKKDEIASWQKYLTSHSLKQPFAQIWEPVIDESSIKEDRYLGCMIPFYRFRGQKKHGITVEDYDFHNEIVISFDDCKAIVERIDWERHAINNDDNFEITSFGFNEYTRKVNHIVAYLDKITVTERIEKDDISISSLLDGFTLAQITEFIDLAAENKCNNCLALLMDFKNKKYSDFDPMDSFLLV